MHQILLSSETLPEFLEKKKKKDKPTLLRKKNKTKNRVESHSLERDGGD